MKRFGLRVAALCPSFAATDMIEEKNIIKERVRPEDMRQPNMEESAKIVLGAVSEMGIME